MVKTMLDYWRNLMSDKKDFKVHNRYLVTIGYGNSLTEVVVLEITQGNNIKLKVSRSDGTTYESWHHIAEVHIAEDLGIAIDRID